MKIFIKLLILFWLLPIQLYAMQDIYHFDSLEQQTRFVALTSQLRCLVCQNQNLAESNAPLAADLRNQIYRHIQQQQSDQQILTYLTARYGDFILYRPPFHFITLGLWLGPLLFLGLGISYLFYYIRHQKRG